MAIADTDGLLVDCNPSFYEASGIPEAQISTVSMFALISPEQLPQTYNWVALVLHERQGEATTLSRKAAFKKNGRYVFFSRGGSTGLTARTSAYPRVHLSSHPHTSPLSPRPAHTPMPLAWPIRSCVDPPI